ncbi:ABC transporter permease [Amycolatopsis sp. 195334CR]|uniref:ABC transporter permease n=1 Tax=Amycolatopsis sp. 195334CR TaxID=2814588 RepID=UPI001A908826|nr:ABC transporter permease [Amycolatopsis sp. 195334CR]MBN6037725.1 ABC transporter permease [Amycolatopsis sp. 195334CR]
MRNSGAGVAPLVRLFLRRDRLLGSGWVALVLLLTAGVAQQYGRLFPSAEAKAQFAAEVGGNSALSAFTGQLTASDLGGLTVWKIGDIVYTLMALMAVLGVIRHTRTEEENGRQELVRSGSAGRYAPLIASLVVTGGFAVLAGVLSTAALIGSGLEPAGSVAFGLAIIAPGLVFAAIAAVAAQLSERARVATVVAMTVLGATYLLRFVADGSGMLGLRWFTPLGWSHLLTPYGEERWAVLLLPLGLLVLATALAFFLLSQRDFGAGVVPAQPGRAHATAALSGPLGLAWRLHRGTLLGWTAAFAAIAAATSSVATGMPALATRSGPAVQEFFRRYSDGEGADLAGTFVWLILVSLGFVAALYPMLAVLRMRSEEAGTRAELTLATATTRLRWAASHLFFAMAGTFAMLLAAGVCAGVVYGAMRGDLAGEFGGVLGAALIQVPAAWTIGAVAMLAYGLLPRASVAISWTVWLVMNLFGETLGPVLGLDYWIANQVVPFHHLPKVLSGGEFSAVPLLALAAVAVALAGAGVAAFRRRDLV